MTTSGVQFVLTLFGLGLLAACAPSHQYIEGRGFYSESFSEGDVEAAAKEGKVRNAGNFSVDASECGIYTSGLADSLIVVPTLKDRLLHMGGNAVQHVKATERADFVLLSILSSFMACGDWTISGDVLYVDRPVPQHRRHATDGGGNPMRQASRRQALWLTLVLAGLVGCTHEVRLVNLSDGTLIKGATKLWDQSVTLTLPSGEIIEGEFFSLSNSKLGPDSLFHGANLGTMFGGRVSGRFHGYAYLTGAQGTVVEIIFASDWTGRGFGFARTSLAEEYRVSF